MRQQAGKSWPALAQDALAQLKLFALPHPTDSEHSQTCGTLLLAVCRFAGGQEAAVGIPLLASAQADLQLALHQDPLLLL